MIKGSTLFLKLVMILLGLAVLALCVLVLPEGLRHTHNWDGYRPLLLAMYIPVMPFYIALYQGYRILQNIDHNQVFSTSSIAALNTIKNCGIVIGGIYALGLPYIFYVAQMDDAPGVVLLGLVFTFAPLAIAVFAAVIRKQLQKTLAIKSENDLTV